MTQDHCFYRQVVSLVRLHLKSNVKHDFACGEEIHPFILNLISYVAEPN